MAIRTVLHLKTVLIKTDIWVTHQNVTLGHKLALIRVKHFDMILHQTSDAIQYRYIIGISKYF